MKNAIWINVTASLLATIASASGQVGSAKNEESFLIRSFPDGTATLTTSEGKALLLPAGFINAIRNLRLEAVPEQPVAPTPCAGVAK